MPIIFCVDIISNLEVCVHAFCIVDDSVDHINLSDRGTSVWPTKQFELCFKTRTVRPRLLMLKRRVDHIVLSDLVPSAR